MSRALPRAGALLLLTTGLLSVAAPASAEAPERTGWWNRLSAPGFALPAPTTQDGDLRIASGADEPSAYSAVLLQAPGSTSGSLVVQLREGTLVGTPEVLACPTTTPEWPEGPNQPFDQAPPYDCAAAQSFGVLAADGLTLSFALDSSLQAADSAPGTWSLALVPNPAADAGRFVLDLQAPGPDSFRPDPPPGVDTAAPAPTTTGPDPFSGEATFGSGSGSFSGGSGLPSFPSTTGTTTPPLLAGTPVAPSVVAPTAPQPAVAGPAGPVLAVRPAALGEDVGQGARLLALLVLAGGSAAVGYAAGQQRPGPRLIGGRASAGEPPVAPDVERRPRGHGRFAKVRDTAPRRLR